MFSVVGRLVTWDVLRVGRLELWELLRVGRSVMGRFESGTFSDRRFCTCISFLLRSKDLFFII